MGILIPVYISKSKIPPPEDLFEIHNKTSVFKFFVTLVSLISFF